jgi:hypothetical protein
MVGEKKLGSSYLRINFLLRPHAKVKPTASPIRVAKIATPTKTLTKPSITAGATSVSVYVGTYAICKSPF